MKKLFFVLLILVFIPSISYLQVHKSDFREKSTQGPAIKFKVLEHNFGAHFKGEDTTYNFEFFNSSTEPLVLSNVRSSTGAITLKWPKEPIHAGKKAEIIVKYDSQRIGGFNKSVTVYSNAGETPIVLRIKGRIVVAPPDSITGQSE